MTGRRAHADHVIADLAGRQHGVVSRAQLLAAGLSAEMIRHRRTRGRLHDLTPSMPGVYLVGSAAEPPLARERAALLSCRGRVVLSHVSAGVLWGMCDRRPTLVDVTAVGLRAPRRNGIRGHRTADLDPGSWRWHRRVPVTSPARTVIDLAASTSSDELEAIVDRGRIAGLLRNGDLRRELAGAGGRRGVAAVRELLDGEQTPGFSRSEAERLALRMISSAQLPPPSGRNARTNGRELDLTWTRQRVVLEVDGRAFHSTPQRFEDDRAKDGALHAAGYRVLRVTWRMLTKQPSVVVARLAAVLALGDRELAIAERLGEGW
ncbi:MAG: DUF559 domain-containing protein [Patulibacter sp.]|nr:DUF559 domain-containing protein [Patulibacter sp.]